jgi:DNA-binding beta-propeller fold protein YncE
MLGLVYLAVAICLGDRICRRFYSFISIPHRWAAAFIVGLLFAGWMTYLTALAFGHASLPLFWGNLCFFAVVIAVFTWPRWRHKVIKAPITEAKELPSVARAPGSNAIDWLCIAGFFAFATWLMFATLNSHAGKLEIANNEYSDFGPNTAIIQSFAVGHNFPTEYPHFSGDRIRYHFLFYFVAGNLEFLGFDPAWGLNLLSILSLVAMLVLVMTLGELIFQSRAVARIGAILFFFFGSLSYIPFFWKEGSFTAAIHNMVGRRDFLPSIFPYRGELWGVWSQVTYANQRHFAMAIGVFLLVLIFLTIQYRAVLEQRSAAGSATDALPAGRNESLPTSPNLWASFIFSGILLGLLPMWNSAVFIAAGGVLAVLLIVCPLRLQMLALGAAAGALALPQILYLSTGAGRVQMPPLFHWGYTIEHPTFWSVISYLGFSFGFKWLLLILALIFATSLQRRFFLAALSLLAIAFSLQLTIEVLANQKFIHIWAIIANLFVAYGLCRLWRLNVEGSTLPGKIAGCVLLLLTIPCGIIDLYPIHNGYWNALAFRNDPLIDWLHKETKPRDIFLTDRFVTHPIFMAGRRVFYGWPYYSWGAGYDATERDRVYRELFENRDPAKVFQLLKEHSIAYVAFDNAVRHGDFIKRPNEQIYAQFFPKVFEDKENRYNAMTIFKVPDKPPADMKSAPPVPVTMFEGGHGTGNGQFNSPRGITTDSAGNIFISDTGNGRIEKFSAAGAFVSSMGTKGAGYGQFGDPNGIAVDRAGIIYVAEASNHRIQKLTPEGNFIAEWKGPDPGFYGPRKIDIGPDQSLYVVDQGRTRIVRCDQDFKPLATWGTKGNGDGQFDDPTSLAVDRASGKVYVADPRNHRIQVFDANGKFLASWPVPEWGRPYGFEDVVVDPIAGRLYASSANMDAVLVFDLNGKRINELKPATPTKLEGVSGMAPANRRLYVLAAASAQVIAIDLR